jgi:Tfp pilus assembly protein PilN
MVIAASLVGAWLLGVVAVVGGLLLENRRVAALETEVAALKKPAAEVEQMKQQVRSLERYAARTHSGLECLREVVALLPEGPELNAFTYKKYAEVNVRGEADSSGPIYDFFQALEKSPLFKEVKPEGVTQQARAGRVRSQFRVTLVLPAEEP